MGGAARTWVTAVPLFPVVFGARMGVFVQLAAHTRPLILPVAFAAPLVVEAIQRGLPGGGDDAMARTSWTPPVWCSDLLRAC